MNDLTADAVIEMLALAPHPEGGWYNETFCDPATSEGRSRSTAIYYLLKRGEMSAWHQVDAVEVWHHYAGAPIELRLAASPETARRLVLGTNLAAGERPQIVAPQGCWQSARSLGDWTLVGCTVAPGFEYIGFRLAGAGEAAALDAALAGRAGR